MCANKCVVFCKINVNCYQNCLLTDKNLPINIYKNMSWIFNKYLKIKKGPLTQKVFTL